MMCGSDDSRVLVIGSSGFIGDAVVRVATRDGWCVRGIARSGEASVSGIASPFDFDQLRRTVDTWRPTVIIHAVGRASVVETERDPKGAYQDSVVPFLTLLEATYHTEVNPRIVFISSAAVYGNPNTLPVSESAQLAPVSEYGRQKLQCERAAAEHSAKTGASVLAARAFSLFGERQQRLLVWELVKRFKETGVVEVRGTGDEIRDYLHIDTFAEEVLAVAKIQLPGFTALNIASGIPTSVRDLAERLARILDARQPIRYLGLTQRGDPMRWYADISLLQSLTGRRPNFNLERKLGCVVRAWQ